LAPGLPPTILIIKKETASYYNFSNIRYGDPATGLHRFKAPKAVTTTNRTLNNGQVASRCPQTHPFWLYDGAKIAQGVPASQLQPVQFNISEIPPMDPEESEDCLFLDVMVPLKIFNSVPRRETSKRHTKEVASKAAPVLVWIDGGGYSAGYKHEQLPAGLLSRSQSQDGEEFIFVAMNYRVGLFVSAACPASLL
jgi:carboxylesterase type B